MPGILRDTYSQVRAMTSEASKSGRIGNSELATQDSLHPVVIRHPLSGREALYVNPELHCRVRWLGAGA